MKTYKKQNSTRSLNWRPSNHTNLNFVPHQNCFWKWCADIFSPEICFLNSLVFALFGSKFVYLPVCLCFRKAFHNRLFPKYLALALLSADGSLPFPFSLKLIGMGNYVLLLEFSSKCSFVNLLSSGARSPLLPISTTVFGESDLAHTC